MLSVFDALAMILQNVQGTDSESIPLSQGFSRILANNLTVPYDSPQFDKALMDGFAIQANEGICDLSVVTFQVIETITAGKTPAHPVADGVASRIMTGAPLPVGSNCVVPIEQCYFDESSPETVDIPADSIRQEANLMRRGTAARAGSTLLNAGSRLQPQQIAALAEFGFGTIEVRRQPRVAVMATGDELIPFDEPLQGGQIRNSNEPMLLAQIEACGAVPISLGIVRDNESQLRTAILSGLQYDVLLLTGGVSAGILDLVPKQLKLAGVEQRFHGVHMKPGKPLWFGCREDNQKRCLVFGLPGNPVSSLACFELFVRPALEELVGARSRKMSMVASLTESIRVKGNRPTYQPVAISMLDGRLIAQPVPWSGSSDLRATVDANGMALLQPEKGNYQENDIVEIWLWGDQRLI